MRLRRALGKNGEETEQCKKNTVSQEKAEKNSLKSRKPMGVLKLHRLRNRDQKDK